MTSWWGGTRLVASRALTQNLRSRAFKVVTGLLLLLSIAVVVLPRLLTGGPPTYTLATVGQTDPAVAAQLGAAARAGDFSIVYTATPNAASVQAAVRNGDATAGLADGTLYVETNGTGTFPGLVAQAVVAQQTASRLAAAGLTPAQVTDLQSIQPPTQVTIGPVEDQGRAAIGFVLAIVLYLALTFAGNAIATAVGTEKVTRISEVLLAVLRPSQILTGNVLAVGAVTLFQLLVLGAPFAVSLAVSDTTSVPTVAAADVVLAVAWFVLGFVLYAFVFAAAATLVDKVSDVGTAVLPVSVTLVLSYLVTIIVVPADPSSPLSTAVSLFPLTAPMAMPVRWASGQVPVYQLALSMLLTALTAVLLLALASTIYRRALVLTGRRVSIREVLTH